MRITLFHKIVAAVALIITGLAVYAAYSPIRQIDAKSFATDRRVGTTIEVYCVKHTVVVVAVARDGVAVTQLTEPSNAGLAMSCE